MPCQPDAVVPGADDEDARARSHLAAAAAVPVAPVGKRPAELPDRPTRRGVAHEVVDERHRRPGGRRRSAPWTDGRPCPPRRACTFELRDLAGRHDRHLRGRQSCRAESARSPDSRAVTRRRRGRGRAVAMAGEAPGGHDPGGRGRGRRAHQHRSPVELLRLQSRSRLRRPRSHRHGARGAPIRSPPHSREDPHRRTRRRRGDARSRQVGSLRRPAFV